MTRFKYSIGEQVYDKWSDDFAVVIQKRIEHGRIYYRLDNGQIRHESQLYAFKGHPVIIEKTL
jgi:hypothetical protein